MTAFAVILTFAAALAGIPASYLIWSDMQVRHEADEVEAARVIEGVVLLRGIDRDERIAAAEAAGHRAEMDVARRQKQRRIRLAELDIFAMHAHHDLDITQEWRVLSEAELAVTS